MWNLLLQDVMMVTDNGLKQRFDEGMEVKGLLLSDARDMQFGRDSSLSASPSPACVSSPRSVWLAPDAGLYGAAV